MTNAAADVGFQKFLFPIGILKHRFPASVTGLALVESISVTSQAELHADYVKFCRSSRRSHPCSAGGALALLGDTRQVVRIASERGSRALLFGDMPCFPT